MATREVPRPFHYDWGSGEIIEEAATVGAHHQPAIQLLSYTEGDAAGRRSIRFCHYGLNGRFRRSPLLLNEAEIVGLRESLQSCPQLLRLLRRLVE